MPRGGTWKNDLVLEGYTNLEEYDFLEQSWDEILWIKCRTNRHYLLDLRLRYLYLTEYISVLVQAVRAENEDIFKPSFHYGGKSELSHFRLQVSFPRTCVPLYKAKHFHFEN